MDEEWRDIKRYEGYYKVSNLGRVKSLTRVKIRKNGSPMPVKERILRLATRGNGYKTITLRKDTYKTHLVHRLVGIAFLKRNENLTQINHKDCNKSNNHISNLEWVTPKENSQHASKNNRLHSPSGANCHFSKRTKEDILLIKELYATGKYTMKDIASIFNTSSGYVCDIVNGKIWKHLQ